MRCNLGIRKKLIPNGFLHRPAMVYKITTQSHPLEIGAGRVLCPQKLPEHVSVVKGLPLTVISVEHQYYETVWELRDFHSQVTLEKAT